MAAFTLDAKQSREETAKGAAMGAVQGGLAGASIGAAGGPVGAAIGAAVGAVAGGVRGGTMANVADRQTQKAAYEVEQDAEVAETNARRDVQASARANRPRAANYAGGYSPDYALPGSGGTGYDAWKGGY
jgi:phage tail tape-measure protein